MVRITLITSHITDRMHIDKSNNGIAFAITQEITHLRNLLQYWKDKLADAGPFSEQHLNVAVEHVERLPYLAQRVYGVGVDDQNEGSDDEGANATSRHPDHENDSETDSMLTMSDTGSLLEMRDMPE